MKKGFTLVELLAVIVILAIIALIATPIVLGVINNARRSSNERSIELYASSLKNAVADYIMLNDGDVPDNYETLVIYLEDQNRSITDYYEGDVVCATTKINPSGSIFLSDCAVNNELVSDFKYGIDETST